MYKIQQTPGYNKTGNMEIRFTYGTNDQMKISIERWLSENNIDGQIVFEGLNAHIIHFKYENDAFKFKMSF